MPAGGSKLKCLANRARRVMPGRQSNFRAVAAAEPFFLQSGDGLRVTDPDGGEYVDFVLAMGAAIWGCGEPRLSHALHAQIEELLAVSSGASQTALEVELAEAIAERVPCAEWVRFGISGSEAFQLALRLARAYTGRKRFVRFAGHYHGWLDNVAEETEGRGPHALDESILIEWNDAEALERALTERGDEVAVVAMEAIMCNNGCCPPRPGYLERVRELCDAHGCLLLFDEVITGFRVSRGGAQEAVGVTPDLATFGKAMCGGMPLSAVAGKRAILELLRDNRVLAGGTFNAFPLGMAAGVTTMRLFDEDTGLTYRRMAASQERLREALRASAQRHGHKLLVQGPLGVTFFAFADCEQAWTPSDLRHADAEKAARFKQSLMSNGVLTAGGNRWFHSPRHTDADIDLAVEAIERAMAELAR